MPEVVFTVDQSKSMRDQAIPGHNRWHPDIPVAAMVNTKAIRIAMILRLFIGPTPLHLAHSVNEVKGSRSKNRDKERREKETRKREQQFDGCLLRFLFGALASFGAQRIGENAEPFRDRRTKFVGLNQHRDETAQIVDARSFS